MAVGKKKIHAAAMQAIELIDVAAELSGTNAFAGMAEDHSRAMFRHRLSEGIIRLWKEYRARNRADPSGISHRMCPLTDGERLAGAIGDIDEANIAVAEEQPVAINAGLA